MALALNLALFLGTLAGMEAVAWWTHRYVMHGWLWSLHRSHHEVRTGVFELNDLFAVFFSAPSMLLIYVGMWVWGPAMYLGLGMTAYGAIYVLFHDALVHRRFRSPIPLRMMKTQVQAHRLHHAVATQYGTVSFGFLWAQPIRTLKRELKAIQVTAREPQAATSPSDLDVERLGRLHRRALVGVAVDREVAGLHPRHRDGA